MASKPLSSAVPVSGKLPIEHARFGDGRARVADREAVEEDDGARGVGVLDGEGVGALLEERGWEAQRVELQGAGAPGRLAHELAIDEDPDAVADRIRADGETQEPQLELRRVQAGIESGDVEGEALGGRGEDGGPGPQVLDVELGGEGDVLLALEAAETGGEAGNAGSGGGRGHRGARGPIELELVDGLVSVGVERGAVAQEVQGRAGPEAGGIGLDVEGDGKPLAAEAQARGVEPAAAGVEQILEPHGVEPLLPGPEPSEDATLEARATLDVLAAAGAAPGTLAGLLAGEGELDEELLGEQELSGGRVPTQGGQLEKDLLGLTLEGGFQQAGGLLGIEAGLAEGGSFLHPATRGFHDTRPGSHELSGLGGQGAERGEEGDVQRANGSESDLPPGHGFEPGAARGDGGRAGDVLLDEAGDGKAHRAVGERLGIEAGGRELEENPPLGVLEDAEGTGRGVAVRHAGGCFVAAGRLATVGGRRCCGLRRGGDGPVALGPAGDLEVLEQVVVALPDDQALVQAIQVGVRRPHRRRPQARDGLLRDPFEGALLRRRPVQMEAEVRQLAGRRPLEAHRPVQPNRGERDELDRRRYLRPDRVESARRHLVVVLRLDPTGRAGDLGDAHLVDPAVHVIDVVSTVIGTDPNRRRGVARGDEDATQ